MYESLSAPVDAYLLKCFNSEKNIPKGIVLAGINTLNPERDKDNRAFIKRAKRLSLKLGYDYAEVRSGEEFLHLLKSRSQIKGMLGNVILFSHGDSLGIFFDNDKGFYDDTVKTKRFWRRFYGLKEGKVFLSNYINEIKKRYVRFHPRSMSVWMTCGGSGLARKIVSQTGVRMIASEGQVVPVNNETETDETGWYLSGQSFRLYLPSRTENLTDLFSPEAFTVKYSDGRLDFITADD